MNRILVKVKRRNVLHYDITANITLKQVNKLEIHSIDLLDVRGPRWRANRR